MSVNYDSLSLSETDIMSDTDFTRELNHERGKSLGTKQLGTILSVIFIINQIYGPGVLAIPIVYQQAGYVTTNLMLLFFFVVSCFSSTMLCGAMALMPGNRKFEKRVEYINVVEHYYGTRARTIFVVFLNITMQAYNIASIVICAQAFDFFLQKAFGHTWALEFYPNAGFVTIDQVDYLYSSSCISISLGYILIMLFSIPMSMLNLDDNVKVVQTASFAFLLILMGVFIGFFIWRGIDGNMEGFSFHGLPFFGKQQTQIVSVFIFSWAYTMFIPSWINEKEDHVSINFAIWISGLISFLGYFFIGGLCAITADHLTSDNLLFRLMQSPTPLLIIVSSYLFALGVIAPGIPVCSITTRYNLYIARVCGNRQSYFWGVFAPWIVGFIFAQGEIFAQLLTWSSLIFNGIINFLLPVFLYYTAITAAATEDEPLLRPIDTPSADIVKEAVVDSSFDPLPNWMGLSASGKKYLILMLFASTLILIMAQIFYDLYFLIFANENLLSS